MGLPPDPSIAPSVAVDLDDGLGEGLECLLRQVVPDARPLAPASAGTGTPPRAPQRTAPAAPRRRSGRLVEEGQVGVGTFGPAARRSMSRTWGLLPTSRNALPERGLGFAPPNERRRRGFPQDHLSAA